VVHAAAFYVTARASNALIPIMMANTGESGGGFRSYYNQILNLQLLESTTNAAEKKTEEIWHGHPSRVID
jgi:hypothetical protein